MSLWTILTIALSFSGLIGVIVFLWLKVNRLEAKVLNLGFDATYFDLMQTQISDLQQSLHDLHASAIERELNMHHRAEPEMDEPLDVTIATAETPSSSYKQAILMVRDGLAGEDVALACNISRAEAELLISLYRNNLKP